MHFLLCDSCTFLFSVVIVFLCYHLWKLTRYQYWQVRGVPCLKPCVPIFGNMYDIIFFKSLVDITCRIYKETKGLPYTGIYAFRTPVLFVNDLDLISNVLVKDFHHFEDRGFNFNSGDSLGRNLIHQSGDDWKYSRAKLTPCFNINRVKSMLPTMVAKSKVLADRLENDKGENSRVETWDACLRYTTDVVTLSILGVDANSLSKEKEHFREAGGHLLGVYFIYHVFTGCFFPRLHRYLGISVCKKMIKRFFHEVINQIINHRKDNSFEKKDFLQTLLALKEESAGADKIIPEIDNNFVAAQSFIFFLAGYETPGTVLACTLFEVAKQPHIQEKLGDEISRVLRRHGGHVSFEALQDMKYMKQVISEALRIYTPLTLIFRRCTADYVIPGTSTVLEKGTLVLVPLRSIHMDPELYPDPQVFDPERFTDENCAARHSAAFMPFGIGPRFCPAVFYSYTTIKAALVHILSQYQVRVPDNMPSKLEASAVHFLFVPKDGVSLQYRKHKSP